MKEKNKRKIGTKYEEIAAGYLEEHGYKILERNYHNKYGELDILAEKDSTLVVVEVKYRSGDLFGDPSEAVDLRKQHKICQTTLFYYMEHGYELSYPCRYDIIAIYGDGTINHIENAFGGFA